MISKLSGAISKVVGAVALIFMASQVAFAQDADVILHNGVIYTSGMDAQFAEAVAVKNGKFLTVGTADAVKAHLGRSTEVIDLKGGFVMPGLVDGHTHGFEDYHKQLFQLQVDESSPEALLRSVTHYAEKHPDKKWITGGGWPNGMFPNDAPTAAMLDEAVADRPVFLIDKSAHSAWLNTKALEMAGFLEKDFEEGKGFVVERDEKGVPNGTVREYAIGFTRRSIDAVPQDEWVVTGREMQGVYHKYGITTTRLASGNLGHVKAALSLEDAGELNLRLSVALNYGYFDSPMSLEDQLAQIKQADDFVSELVDPRTVKIFVDGTQLASQAWNVKPYPDDPANFGTAYYSQDQLNELYDQMTKLNRQILSHATGSMAVRAVLNAIEFSNNNNPDTKVRHHLSHSIQIEPEDLGRAIKLDIAVEMSPIMILNPGLLEQISDKVGRETVDDMWPARAAIDAGDRVAFASDWNVSPLDPWAIMEYLITRENREFPEMGKISPENAISVKEALDGYTINAAYAINLDDVIGSIEVGKSADLIVLDRNPFELEKSNQLKRIGGTKVLYAVLQGKVVFKNKEDLMPSHHGGTEHSLRHFTPSPVQ